MTKVKEENNLAAENLRSEPMPAQILPRSSNTSFPEQIKKAKHALATNTTPTTQYIVLRQFVAPICRRLKMSSLASVNQSVKYDAKKLIEASRPSGSIPWPRPGLLTLSTTTPSDDNILTASPINAHGTTSSALPCTNCTGG